MTSRDSAWSTAERVATARKSLGVKTLPRPLARTRFMTRSGTEAAIVFMCQKKMHLFLACKRRPSQPREVRFRQSRFLAPSLLKLSMTVLCGAGGEIDADQKVRARRPIGADRCRSHENFFWLFFPLKSTAYDFDGLRVGFSCLKKRKSELDQRSSWVLSN